MKRSEARVAAKLRSRALYPTRTSLALAVETILRDRAFRYWWSA